MFAFSEHPEPECFASIIHSMYIALDREKIKFGFRGLSTKKACITVRA